MASGMRAWSSFIAKLSYKAESADRLRVKVNARGASQPCPCGAPVPKKLWDRLHQCAACGLQTTRDHASALEILRRGLRLRTETPAIAGVALEAPSFSYGRSHFLSYTTISWNGLPSLSVPSMVNTVVFPSSDSTDLLFAGLPLMFQLCSLV
jgi:hypothetical protein